MKKLFVFAIALLAVSACVRTHKGNPHVPSIEGSWLVTDMEVTADGDGADEAKAILLDIFDGFEGFTLEFNPDNTVVLHEGVELYSMTNFDLWIITMSDARVMFTVNILTGTDMELTCNALTGIGEPIVFPPGVTEAQVYITAKRE